MKKLTKFWVFGNMSRDPPGGLLGPLGGFSLCRFYEILVEFSSILGGSRDHLGVILGSSFKGSRGVPNIKKLTNFWVFENMSRDPPGGLLGPLGGVSLCRFYKILKNFWGSQNRSRTLPGAFLAPPRKFFFRPKNRVQMVSGRSPTDLRLTGSLPTTDTNEVRQPSLRCLRERSTGQATDGWTCRRP